MKAKKLVYGVGVNDSAVPVHTRIEGKVVACKIYSTWQNMLGRCYSARLQGINPTYIGCSVADEWHSFNNFRGWVLTQEWEGLTLDKDILVPGNKVYSKETCVFVSYRVNGFLVNSNKIRGDLPVGVFRQSRGRTYGAQVSDRNKVQKLGYFDTLEEAHQAYRTAKYELAVGLASEQSDPRVAAALIERYKL